MLSSIHAFIKKHDRARFILACFIPGLIALSLLPITVNAQPIVIKTANQQITLPAHAKRIVVLEFSLLDDLLQLGIKPIGIAASRVDEGTNPPFLLPQIQGIEEVGTRQQPNLEKIISLHPDLIVADETMQGSIYPLLSKIAPTLLLNGLLGNPDTQIQNLNLLAKATGSQSKVEALTKQLTSQYQRAKEMSAKHSGTVLIGYISHGGQFQALTANALTSQILLDWGYRNLITITRKEQSTPIPLETLLALNPDNIIVLLTDDDIHPYHTLIKNPLWKTLRAVQTSHVYLMDRDIWAKNHGVLATLLMLKEAENTGFLSNLPNHHLN